MASVLMLFVGVMSSQAVQFPSESSSWRSAKPFPIISPLGSPWKKPEALPSSMVPLAPTPATCVVPWLDSGRWLDCTSEVSKMEGEVCTFEHQFGMECKYPDGPIPCSKNNLFEIDKQGEVVCTKIHHPKDGRGCARFDVDPNTCKLTEGCHWSSRSWCEISCRSVEGCGVELHRRNVQCATNCPLGNASKCQSWQAGCACIQDTSTIDCESWCQLDNAEEFVWLNHTSYQAANHERTFLKEAHTRGFKSTKRGMRVGDALDTEDATYDPIRLCQDACFMRGICVSPNVDDEDLVVQQLAGDSEDIPEEEQMYKSRDNAGFSQSW